MNKDAISVAIAANVPFLVTGAPGIGKTSYHQALALEHGAYMETVIASLRDPTDFGGLPIKVANKEGEPGVYLAPPLWAKRLNEAAERGTPAWLFIDEITTAAPATQAALLRVIHERVVGDLPLDPAVRMIAAANPPDQAAGGWDLSPPLANRFFHMQWTVTPKEWADGLMQGFPMPAAVKVNDQEVTSLEPKYRSLVAGYVHSKGMEALINVPKDEAKAGGAWPSPRTWEMATRLMATREAAGFDKDLDVMLLRGSIGDGEAIGFHKWVKEQNLPNPEDLLKNAADFKLPERGDVVYTVLNSVVAAVIGDLTPARWKAGWTVLKKAGEQGAFDVGCAAARTLAQQATDKLDVPLDEIKPYVQMLIEAGLVKKGASA